MIDDCVGQRRSKILFIQRLRTGISEKESLKEERESKPDFWVDPLGREWDSSRGLREELARKARPGEEVDYHKTR